MTRVLNWKRDPAVWKLPVHLPRMLNLPAVGAKLPPATDLRPVCPPVYDQGDLGSCTANAGVGVFEIKQKVEGDDQGPASRLFVYYCARALQGTESTDSGSTTTTTMRAIVDWGLPPETLWPYDVAQFAVHPPHAVYAAGRPLRPTSAMVVRITQDHDHIVAMMAEQAAISFGFDVPQSFMSQQVAETGVWSGPEANDPIIGGHEVVIVGSNDADGTFLFRNSWGTGWGMAGYGTMPQSFVLSPSCADFIAAVGAPA